MNNELNKAKKGGQKNETIELANVGKQTVSSKYTLGYLMCHPKTKAIVYKYYKKYPYLKEPYTYIGGTLDDMFNLNMGGGFEYEDITNLMKELNTLKLPLIPEYSEEDSMNAYYDNARRQ